MPRRCTVCSRVTDRETINARLLAGESTLVIAEDYGLSYDALFRHRKTHLARVMASAAEAAVEMLPPESAQVRLKRAEKVLQLSRGADLVEHLEQLRSDARAIQRGAEASGDRRAALLAIRELIRIIEIHGKVTGQIASGSSVNLMGVQVNSSGSPVIALELLDQIFAEERERTGSEDIEADFRRATADFVSSDFQALWEWCRARRESSTRALLDAAPAPDLHAADAGGQPKPDTAQNAHGDDSE